MKKLFVCFLAALMLFSFAACVPEKEEQTQAQSSTESVTEPPKTQENPKIDPSKTLDLFRRILADGEYTLRYTAYSKKLDGSGEFESENGTENLYAYQGKNIYKLQKNALLGASETVIDGEFTYGIFHEGNMIIKEKYRPMHEKNKDLPTFGDGEEDYYNMVGDPKQMTVWGKSYYCEHFSFDAESVDYLYEGDELRFILPEIGGTQALLKVEALSSDADPKCFQLPEGYSVVG